MRMRRRLAGATILLLSALIFNAGYASADSFEILPVTPGACPTGVQNIVAAKAYNFFNAPTSGRASVFECLASFNIVTQRFTSATCTFRNTRFDGLMTGPAVESKLSWELQRYAGQDCRPVIWRLNHRNVKGGSQAGDVRLCLDALNDSALRCTEFQYIN